MQRSQHWDQVYQTKAEAEVSWFEVEPATSLDLIRSVLPAGGSVIDIGSGASHLVDHLLEQTTGSITLLDVSAVALQKVKERLGANAERVHWIVGDVTQIEQLPTCDVWHDRAVFHFLTSADDRRRYIELAVRTIAANGYLIVGVFAPDGPAKCSGLEVCRYDAAGLASEFGKTFCLLRTESVRHTTPAGKSQSFCFAVFQHRPQEVAA
jgi:ubiquinone/menaquinone biosynthesis C-methylase UbiE